MVLCFLHTFADLVGLRVHADPGVVCISPAVIPLTGIYMYYRVVEATAKSLHVCPLQTLQTTWPPGPGTPNLLAVLRIRFIRFGGM